MKIPGRLFIFQFLLISIFTLRAEDSVNLRFIHREGEVIHADSLVDETVYVNGYLSHQAEVDEFSVSTVRQVKAEGQGVLDSSFRTVERVEGYPGFLEWVSSETVRLERNIEGKLTVPFDAYRPVLRDVPRFPDYPVKPGDTWSFPAEEVHVFRINNSLYGPYRGSTQVLYKYISNEDIKGHIFARLSFEYSIYLPIRSPMEPIRLISGRSSQELLWDLERGRPELKVEDFEFLMMMTDGRTQEFVGKGRTTYRISDSLDRPKTVESLKKDLRTIPGITVESTDEGILLSVVETDRILFDPDSSHVSEDQKYRLEELARTLKAYPDRDVLITGHTADYGTYEGRKLLSRERAAAVADILFPEGRTGSGRLFLRGAGNTEPLGSDQADRRVEILILD